ncbi:MAG TPA: hypothetical protein VHL09_09755 [Dehalococcoidia bacterium]|nr:hypothetical protein [Dehalococcoidia bacterium]
MVYPCDCRPPLTDHTRRIAYRRAAAGLDTLLEIRPVRDFHHHAAGISDPLDTVDVTQHGTRAED